jgi:hypothetical protein
VDAHVLERALEIRHQRRRCLRVAAAVCPRHTVHVPAYLRAPYVRRDRVSILTES